MNRKALFAMAATVVGVPMALQPAPANAEDRIVGLWNVTVTLTNCATGDPLPFPGATFEAMGLYEDSGTFHDTNAMSPIIRSAGLGTWVRVGARVYDFAFRNFRFDSTGTLPIGSQIIRHRVVLAENGESYSSSGTAEFYDVSGIRLLPDGCSKSEAQRFN